MSCIVSCEMIQLMFPFLVCVSNSEVPTATAVPAFNPAAASDFVLESGSGNKSPAVRMRELDEMRGLLTDKEYQMKRAEILSAV